MMKLAFNKPGATPTTANDLEKYKEERQGLEVDLLDEILGSRQRAWKVAGWVIRVGLFGMALAGFVVWRYSQPVPEHCLSRTRRRARCKTSCSC